MQTEPKTLEQAWAEYKAAVREALAPVLDPALYHLRRFADRHPLLTVLSPLLLWTFFFGFVLLGMQRGP